MNTFSSLSQTNYQQSDNPSFQIDLSGDTKSRNVRVIHCGDGVIEECSEDEEELERKEELKRKQEQEQREKLDIEAKNMNWLPWMGYMAQKSAWKSLEVCDSMGEKLAWWFGITRPKYLYEIEEYNRMKLEEEANQDDIAEEIVIGVDHKVNKTNSETMFLDKLN